MKTPYLPVSCDFHDELLALASRKEKVKVFIFNKKGTLDSISGLIIDVFTKNREEFLQIDTFTPIRLDKIITYNGKPGPSYEIYQSMGDFCHDCKE